MYPKPLSPCRLGVEGVAVGLFAITYQLSAQINLDTVAALLQFSAVVLGATLVHGLIVLPAIACG